MVAFGLISAVIAKPAPMGVLKTAQAMYLAHKFLSQSPAGQQLIDNVHGAVHGAMKKVSENRIAQKVGEMATTAAKTAATGAWNHVKETSIGRTMENAAKPVIDAYKTYNAVAPTVKTLMPLVTTYHQLTPAVALASHLLG